jgi:hypothetical protein
MLNFSTYFNQGKVFVGETSIFGTRIRKYDNHSTKMEETWAKCLLIL